MHADTPANSIFDGPITQLSVQCILVEVPSPVHAKGGGSLSQVNDFKFGTSTGRFASVGAAGMAVKGLIKTTGVEKKKKQNNC